MKISSSNRLLLQFYKVKKVHIPPFLYDLPLDSEDYDNLYIGMIFLAVFTLIFVIIYLAVGEEREETEI